MREMFWTRDTCWEQIHLYSTHICLLNTAHPGWWVIGGSSSALKLRNNRSESEVSR